MKKVSIIGILLILLLTGCKGSDNKYENLKNDLYNPQTEAFKEHNAEDTATDITTTISEEDKELLQEALFLENGIDTTPIITATATPTPIEIKASADNRLNGLKINKIDFDGTDLYFRMDNIKITLSETDENDKYSIFGILDGHKLYPSDYTKDKGYHFVIDGEYSLTDIKKNMEFYLTQNSVILEVFRLDSSYNDG